MTTSRSLILTSVFLITTALNGVTFAQSPAVPPTPPAPPMEMHPHMQGSSPVRARVSDAKREDMREKRQQKFLNDMKVFLQLQATQEAAWQSFSANIKAPYKHPERPSPAEMEKLTTPERIEKLMRVKKERDDEMVQRFNATNVFYAALTPAQQKVFDTQTQKLMVHGPYAKILNQHMGEHKHHHGKMQP